MDGFFEILSDTQVHIIENGNIVMKTVDDSSAFIDAMFGDGKAAEWIANSDPRNQPDYYKVRAEAGQKLVNDITNKLLLELKSGVRSLADTMAIEVKLDGVISSLNFGQLITAKVKVSQVTGIDTALLNEIKASIDQLNLTHYA